jgi:DNA polymerase III epsilon subunit-like protein
MESAALLVVLGIALLAFVIAARLQGRVHSRSAPPARHAAESEGSPTPACASPSPPQESPRVAPQHSRRAMARIGSTPFAIVDVETTGFRPVPDGRNRIVEIAIVRLTPEGRIEDEYVTLVNPHGPMGATHIHGISASDVASAPAFGQIAGDVSSRLADAIVVAHNAPFDVKFLRGEFAHAGFTMPDVPRLCTLDLAYRFADVSCRKLGVLCEEYGIAIDAHSALGDARAVSQLLLRFLEEARNSGQNSAGALGFTEVPVLGSEWCYATPSGLLVRRGVRATAPEAPTTPPAAASRSALEAVLSKRSVRRSGAMKEQQYLDALELALGDGEFTPEESAALCSFALELGLSVADLHLRYVQSLADGATADGVVTPGEAAEVHRIAALLGVAAPAVERMLSVKPRARWEDRLSRGAGVCIVGSLDTSVQAKLLSAMSDRGFVARKNITASVGVVVVESPRSEVQRQDRARALGVPIVTAEQFLTVAQREIRV